MQLEDESEREFRLLTAWFCEKFRGASLLDVANIIIGVVLLFVGIVAACIYSGQLKEMRNTNELTKRALAGSDSTLRETLAKMQLQADAMNRLAQATENATVDSIEADRPWIGQDLWVTDFEVGKVPQVHIRFVNSGRRPAYVTLTNNNNKLFSTFPDDPPFLSAPSNSSTLTLVPGKAVQKQYAILKVPLSQSVIDVFADKQKTWFIYAKVEYLDSRTKQKHRTHTCIFFAPPIAGADSAWPSCHVYNTAD